MAPSRYTVAVSGYTVTFNSIVVTGSALGNGGGASALVASDAIADGANEAADGVGTGSGADVATVTTALGFNGCVMGCTGTRERRKTHAPSDAAIMTAAITYMLPRRRPEPSDGGVEFNESDWATGADVLFPLGLALLDPLLE